MTRRSQALDKALVNVQHWTWTFHTQADRFLEGGGFIRGFRVEGPERRKGFSRAAADRHFLALAGRHVCVAVTAACELGLELPRPRGDQSEALRLLRNIYEHWPDYLPWKPDSFTLKNQRTRSGAKLVNRWPNANAWQYREDGLLGGAFHMRDFADYLKDLEPTALRLSGHGNQCP